MSPVGLYLCPQWRPQWVPITVPCGSLSPQLSVPIPKAGCLLSIPPPLWGWVGAILGALGWHWEHHWELWGWHWEHWERHWGQQGWPWEGT